MYIYHWLGPGSQGCFTFIERNVRYSWTWPYKEKKPTLAARLCDLFRGARTRVRGCGGWDMQAPGRREVILRLPSQEEISSRPAPLVPRLLGPIKHFNSVSYSGFS